MVLNLTKESLLLDFYMSTMIGTFGIVSNIFNIIVSSRSKIQEITTMGFFNVSLSCVNIFAIVFVYYLMIFPQSIGKSDLMSTSIYACLLIPFFARVLVLVSYWLNVLISYDRICIFDAHYRTHFINNRKHLRLLLLVIFFVACLVTVPNLLFHLEYQTQFDSSLNSTHTITICTSSNLIQTLRDASAAVFLIVLPIFLQTTLNIILIKRLFKHRKNRDPTLKKEKTFSFTILVFNIVFLSVNYPISFV